MKYHKRNHWYLPFMVFRGKQPEPVLSCMVVHVRRLGFRWYTYELGNRASIITLKDRKKDLIVGWKNWGSHMMGGRRGVI
jgi:hypothetical protein